MAATTLWSRAVVANRILAGETLIIYQGHLLSIPPAWLDAHPGGNLALLHFVGKDATDEIEANHLDDTLKLVSRYSIGRVELTEDGWEPLVPPIATGWVRRPGRSGKQEWFKEATELVSNDSSHLFPSSSILLVERNSHFEQLTAPSLASLQPLPSDLSLKVQTRLSRAYRELHKRITDAGLYKTRYISGYGPEIARYTLFGCISAYAYSCNWFITSAVFLGLFWHQLAFAAHDLGHMGVTHNWTIDRILATLIADFMGGISIGWWVQVRSF
jgi:delta8-fatty-acid desaturase